MKYLLIVKLILVMLFASLPAWAKSHAKVLMVVSSYGVDKGETQPGYEFDEFAKAYLTFVNSGLEVDVASPAGGSVEADEYNPGKPYNTLLLADKVAMGKLSNTKKTAELTSADYGAVFVVGGKGAMFDLPKDVALQKLIADIYEQQGVVSAVCHGPAALVNVTLSDGSSLVQGKRVNGFTNQEESLFGKKWAPHFEFMLEDELKAKGGIFESSPMMMSHVSVDERLITGQNPFSTSQTAEQVVIAMGKTPVKVAQDQESRTIALIARLLDSDQNAKQEYQAQPEQYQTPLIGMYGYYLIQQPTSQQDVAKAVDLMELANKQMQHPRLFMAIAEGQIKMDKTQEAIGTLQTLLKSHPDNEDAATKLAELSAS